MALTSIPFSAFAEGEVHTHDGESNPIIRKYCPLSTGEVHTHDGESNAIDMPLDFREKTAVTAGAGIMTQRR